MSEPVIHLFYGIPLSKSPEGKSGSRSAAMTKMIEKSLPGLHTFYSSNSYFSEPAAFGVLIDTVYPGNHHTEFQSLPEHTEEFRVLFQALEPKIQAELLKYGAPRNFILWATA